MAQKPRYAIYFVPAAETALYRFGASVLGYDGYSGRDIALIDGAGPSWTAWVREPRVYGFHATLKAPIWLVDGTTEAQFLDAVAAFALERQAFDAGELTVRQLGSFIALVPAVKSPLLDELAGDCVRAFDRFRAPMLPPERARRMAAHLNARQIENVERWGYPYVFEDFRFHMTLTGALDDPDRQQAFKFLCGKFEQASDARLLTVDRIVVARQDGNEPFKAIGTALLGRAP